MPAKRPRRRRTRIPAYRLHKSSGHALVTLSGRDFYLGVHGTQASKDEYDRLVAEWIANGRTLSEDIGVDGFTVNELILAYWRHAETHYVKHGRPTSQLHQIKASLRFIRRLWGTSEAAEFGPLKLKAVRELMLDADPKLSRKTVNRYVKNVRQMFKWGVGSELVSQAVWRALEAVEGLRKGRTSAPETRPVRTVSPELVAAVRPHVPRQVWAMIRLQELTGMRPGEVTTMRAIDVNTAGDVWIYTPQEHKTEHHDDDGDGLAREVFLGPQAQDVVREFLTTDLHAYLFSPREAEAERRADQRRRRKSPVQPSQVDRRKPAAAWAAGDRYDTCSYRRAITRACELAFGMPPELRNIAAALKDVPEDRRDAERDRLRKAAAAWRAEHCWAPNQLRHNAGTRARHVDGLEAAQVILGHSEADVTQIYAERNRERAIAFMRKHG
jgi:integrase